MDVNDKVLWQSVKHDDHQAFRMLFMSYYKPLCLYVLQFTRDLAIAEDIVQEVFVKLWERRKVLNISGSVRNYLFKAVYHSYIDEFRKNHKKNTLLDELTHEALISSYEEEVMERHAKLEEVCQLMEELPKQCKRIVLMSKKEGYKNREIAERLGISIKTVEAQLRIAFQKIRKGLGHHRFLVF
ncbi:MAG: RNA polymerase sigma-70 factor [Bacteroidota bacterium]